MISICPARTCNAQAFEIRVPPDVASEKLVIRYFLEGGFGGYNGWISPRSNQRVYSIATSHQGQPAAGLKSVLYAPGCALETLSRSLTDARERFHEFLCRKQPEVPLAATLTHMERLTGKDLVIQAVYVAWWAHQFFGKEDGPVVTTFHVGETASDADGHFTISLPDFSGLSSDAAFQFQARDKTTGKLYAQLVPNQLKGRAGSLQIAAAYPDNLIFSACLSGLPVDHAKFTTRGYASACE
jgi:hypothetical protein